MRRCWSLEKAPLLESEASWAPGRGRRVLVPSSLVQARLAPQPVHPPPCPCVHVLLTHPPARPRVLQCPRAAELQGLVVGLAPGS